MKKRALILFIERHTRFGRGIAMNYFPDWLMSPWNWFHGVLLRSNLEEYQRSREEEEHHNV